MADQDRSPEDRAGRAPNDASDTLGQSKGTATREGGGLPPAGPHADPSLINPDATPGAGTLPDATPGGDDADQATG
jgi:hypothetical protein